MKIDMDLVREMLLEAERIDDDGHQFDLGPLKEWTKPQIKYHAWQLINGGLVHGRSDVSNGDFSVYHLTWNGHQLLETIRDPKIWRDVKAAANKYGGIMSVEGIKILAAYTFKSLLPS